MQRLNVNNNIKYKNEALTSFDNRGFTYGDAVFETVHYTRGKILFWEDHYFRLMASMRILRMEIPLSFTPESLLDQFTELLQLNNLEDRNARIKLIVFRDAAGLYTPDSNTIGYVIDTKVLEKEDYFSLRSENYEVSLYKDHYVAPDLLSTLKSNNKIINVLGSIYAKENGYQNCLLLNTNKSVVEALNGNIFLIKDNKIKTPPLADGCLRGVMRKKLLELLKKNPNFQIEEASISPFELQKADEIFITNVIQGIVPISKYKKKEFSSQITQQIFEAMQTMAKLSI